jgi:hypothetical protein
VGRASWIASFLRLFMIAANNHSRLACVYYNRENV